MEKSEMIARKYPSRRRELLKFLQDGNDNIAPGLDNEILDNCILMIVDYFNYHLPNMKIPSSAIPDADKFRPKGLKEYTIEQFIYNRIYNNLQKFEIRDKPPAGRNPSALGGYKGSTKSIDMFDENFKKHIKEKCQSIDGVSEEDILQEVLVHELIHAISKAKSAGQGITYFDEFGVKHNVSLNEGITEALAMDICELNHVFLTFRKDNFQIAGNTTSAYKLETSIANLWRVADGEKFYIKYLVNADRIMIKRGNIDLMKAAKEMADLYRPARDEDVERAKVTEYQSLQYMLLKDIYINKLNSEILEPVKRGAPFDRKKFIHLRKEMYEIGKCLIPTIRDNNDNEELDFTSSLDHVREMMDSGKIARTPNIEMFVELVDKINEAERKFGIPPRR